MGVYLKQYTQDKPPLGSQINWGHPLAKGLVGCWLMNEGGGLIVNDIARKNNGTIVNGALWKPAKNGIGLDFDGTNDYVDCGNGASLQISGAITVLAWVKPTATNDFWYKVVSKGENTWGMELKTSSSTYGFTIYDTSWRTALGGTYTPNTWVCLIGRYTGGTSGEVSVWINGVKGSTTANANYIANPTALSLNIGRNASAIQYGAQTISEIMIWNRALSPSEILQLYQDPYCFIAPPRYRFYSLPAGVAETPPVNEPAGFIMVS